MPQIKRIGSRPSQAAPWHSGAKEKGTEDGVGSALGASESGSRKSSTTATPPTITL
ncbi:hypothetical protein ACN6LK_004746 [Streptomyces griseus]|uniref:hypothetical protein n=1 Tax=Streptomyces griseus TaxID=1911 RepID=UPI00403D363C